MKVAAAIQQACSDQRARDLAEIRVYTTVRSAVAPLIDALHRTELVIVRRARCGACDFWRDRYDAAVDEVEHLLAELRHHHIRPRSRITTDTEPAAAG